MNHKRLRESVARHEGYRNIPYRDHLGHWTVGYGHLIHRIDLTNMANYRTVGGLLDFLTDVDQHERWFDADLNEAESDARRFVGDAWHSLSEIRQEVITEMAFQMGGDRLGNFRKFREAIMAGLWGMARTEMLDSLWARQTPSRAKTLADRFLAG